MKRRVLIAKALIHEPKILFLDEPTAGVDIEIRKSIWEMINSIKTQIYLDESWIKPKNLVNLRWLAIVGQGVAIAVTDLVLGLTFNVEACLTIILFSCIFLQNFSDYIFYIKVFLIF